MSRSEQYQCFIGINLEHEFFGDTIIPVELIPEKHLADYFKQKNILIKRYNNIWRIYATEKNLNYLKEDLTVITLEIKVNDSVFYYVSDLVDYKADDHTLQKKDDKINQINISTKAKEINIKINSVYKYVEYILFPRNIQLTSNLEIVETRKMLKFNRAKIIEYGEKEKVLQFVSKEKIKLRNTNNYFFNIIEKLEYGEKKIKSNLAMPRPQNQSVFYPNQAITAIYII